MSYNLAQLIHKLRWYKGHGKSSIFSRIKQGLPPVPISHHPLMWTDEEVESYILQLNHQREYHMTAAEVARYLVDITGRGCYQTIYNDTKAGVGPKRSPDGTYTRASIKEYADKKGWLL